MVAVNLLDVGIVLMLAILVVRSGLRGVSQEVAGLLGLILAFYLARHFQIQAQKYVEQLFGPTEWATLGSYVLIFVAVLLASAFAGQVLRKLVSVTFSSWLDHLLGAFVGAAKGLLIATAIFYLLLRFLPDSPVVTGALTAPFFKSMSAYLREFLPALQQTFSI